MPKIIYIAHDGSSRTVEAKVGVTVMDAAVRNNVTGIVAECGGACACATCHVHVDAAWLEATGPRGVMEESMLEFAEGAAGDSRLSCQIKVTDVLDGLVVRTPETQG